METPMSSFISQNFTEIEVVTGCTFACICHTVFRMFPCLQINWQPFYLASCWNSIHLIGWSKFIFKPRTRVLTITWYHSNQCLVSPSVMKGVNKGQFKNPMTHYEQVLTSMENFRACNSGNSFQGSNDGYVQAIQECSDLLLPKT